MTILTKTRESTILPTAPTPDRHQAGIIGWAFMWWLGVPFTVLLIVWFLFFR